MKCHDMKCHHYFIDSPERTYCHPELVLGANTLREQYGKRNSENRPERY